MLKLQASVYEKVGSQQCAGPGLPRNEKVWYRAVDASGATTGEEKKFSYQISALY